ncbi:hypothetical protein PP175_06170 [Aneurinibacillus sp. Ricciae_BoGa-3]|uniref:hypothetical protein n=1 Tax=Aneurinibacillus sp. Ricciae_BoGa-3 TaxID=3022697 RepID=UPI0023412AB4|nr:hypothetical protein [Aneurinibacillus sp. Ricciae_BoGa-3]WCK55532.1 hypothetical protein PP175_06170 [Aneurinibacillus sp. Ricciae_BoGa-3]
MNKIWGVAAKLLVTVFLPLGIDLNVQTAVQAAPVSQSTDGRFRIEVQGWTAGIKPQVITSKHAHAVYTTYNYKVGSGGFSLTQAKMENDDCIFFAHLESIKAGQPVMLRLTVNDPTVKQAITLADCSVQPAAKPKDGTNVSLPVFIDGPKAHYRIGPAVAFQPLGASVYKRVAQTGLAAKVSKSSNGLMYEWKLPSKKGEVYETWGILSSNLLVNWGNKEAIHQLESASFDFDKVLRADGAYYPNEETYRPYAVNSIYYNPANLDGFRSLPFLNNADNGTYFEDIATHLAYASLQNQTPKGYWETQPLSTWLNNDYKLQAPYMDDRRNADNATFLQYYIRFRSDEEIDNALDKWDRYAVSYIKSNAVQLKTGGLLVPDYRDNYGHTTHIALNHHIALANYLLERYISTHDVALKSLALEMIKGVELTKELWVKPNHDLYYSISQRLKPTTSLDYRELTRDDMAETQRLLQKVQGEPSPALQFLIDSKNKWLGLQ